MPPSAQGRSSSPATTPKATVLIFTGTGTTVSPSSERESLAESATRVRIVATSRASRYAAANCFTPTASREASFSSAYMAGKFFACQASAKRLAASFSGDPGAPMAAPTTNATSARAPRGSARVSSRLRRSSSGDWLLTGGKVIERSGACLYSVGDRVGLGDHRLHSRPRPVGVSARADRRRAHPRGVRGRRVPRLAARPAGPLPGQRFAVCAALRGDRGAAGRCAGGGGARGDRPGPAPAGELPR